ncbi:hypothetical protein CK203_103433 [Vitis vinifera]|uniref:H15 domain-containing protein n=1 Tax=Vitis vinifera TaxID=29760 RepID=A0A438D7A0_VITVI|nr:hypothetical protein CK203_103433 [Vitis vinifera]
MSYFHCCRLDNLILEAITNLKEPGGSNKTTIATYIESLAFSDIMSSVDLLKSKNVFEDLKWNCG